jgi:hypothetical protein
MDAFLRNRGYATNIALPVGMIQKNCVTGRNKKRIGSLYAQNVISRRTLKMG